MFDGRCRVRARAWQWERSCDLEATYPGEYSVDPPWLKPKLSDHHYVCILASHLQLRQTTFQAAENNKWSSHSKPHQQGHLLTGSKNNTMARTIYQSQPIHPDQQPASSDTDTYTVDIINLNNLLARLEQNIFLSSSAEHRPSQQSHLECVRIGAVRSLLGFITTRERSMTFTNSFP